jgi:hypothetical protein
MTNERRFLSPAVATVAGALVVAAATLGGTFANDAPAEKTDRFEVMGDALCEGQAWPHLSPECLAWAEGEVTEGKVRFVTMVDHDMEDQVTTLTKVPAEVGH